MRKIDGKAKTVRELLKGVKYSIDYYQREYKWHDKQIRELVDDLSGKFLEEFQIGHERSKVADYPHYFLGSIIISEKDSASFIVDGQQRLTSLTLLLILLRNLQVNHDHKVNVDELIFSEKYNQKSFNIHVPERIRAMEALYQGSSADITDAPESVQNLIARYRDLEDALPQELRGESLPYFIDWLLENVHLVEITAYSDSDAYTIFETMNDRGLSLSPTDMLKGFLLASINEEKRTLANNLWRSRIRELNDAGKEVEPDCFKAWLRSQYATKIRERKSGAKAENFDRIGTEFHRWLKDEADEVGLKSSDTFYDFINRDFNFYSRVYLRIVEASTSMVAGLEHIFYNAQHNLTLQNMLLLAPLKPDDDLVTVNTKLAIVARYVDILVTWRLWNFRSIGYSTMQYSMFVVMREIRGLSIAALATKLYESLLKEKEKFSTNERLSVHQQNRYALHRMLARLTDYVETQSGQPSHYAEFVAEGPGRYEVEHIWANHAERHTGEFAHTTDFAEFRNRIGGLLLLPKKFNASYGDLTYEDKLPHYLTQNLLARSLHTQCYEHNPGFAQFVERDGLFFKAHATFKKTDLEERGALYRQLAEKIWNPTDLLKLGGL